MKNVLSRTAYAALLATSVGAGFAVLAPAAALAQASPASPNYSYDVRNKTGAWDTGGYAVIPASEVRHQNGLSARAAVIDDDYRGQDPDANVRLQTRRTEGMFDR
jgi:hypothetical protein